MSTRHALFLALALSACDRASSGAASGDAVTAALPASANAIVRVSLADLRGSPNWPVVDALMTSQRPMLDTVEQACGIRMLDVVDAVTLAGDGAQRGFAVLIIEGRFTRAQAEDCFAKVVAVDRGATVRAKLADDGITDLIAEGFPEQLHVRWLRDGAVVVPMPDRLTDRALLERLGTGPRLDAGRLGAEIRAVAGGTGWAAAVGDEQRGPPALMEPLASLAGPVPPRRARMRVDAKGALAIELRLGFANDAEATAAAATVRTRLTELAADPRAGGFAELLVVTSVEAQGPEVTLRASLTDDASAAIITEISGGFFAPTDAIE